MCDTHWQIYKHAMTTKMKGIDRPDGVAPEDWKGSLLDHIRHARIAIAFEERYQRAALVAANPNLSRPADERFTNAELEGMMNYRRLCNKYFPHGWAAAQRSGSTSAPRGGES